MASNFLQRLFAPLYHEKRVDLTSPPRDVIPTEAGAILGIAMEIGAEMLKSGAEVHRVEDTITRICHAYGAVQVDVFALTSLISAEIRMLDDSYATRTRRVLRSYNHLSRLESLNALSREICASPMTEKQAKERLNEIRDSRPIPEWLCYLATTIGVGAFAIFFGGGWRDGLAAALVALILTFIKRKSSVVINEMARTVISSFLGGILGVLTVVIGLGVNRDAILIGTIMMEIPGLVFGNALRDLLCGDTLAGGMRLVQALLQALMIALGYMAAILVCGQIWGV